MEKTTITATRLMMLDCPACPHQPRGAPTTRNNTKSRLRSGFFLALGNTNEHNRISKGGNKFDIFVCATSCTLYHAEKIHVETDMG